jgi:hypothetical protein
MRTELVESREESYNHAWNQVQVIKRQIEELKVENDGIKMQLAMVVDHEYQTERGASTDKIIPKNEI